MVVYYTHTSNQYAIHASNTIKQRNNEHRTALKRETYHLFVSVYQINVLLLLAQRYSVTYPCCTNA